MRPNTSRKSSRKQSPKVKEVGIDDISKVMLEQYGFDINNNEHLQQLYLRQCFLDSMVDKGLLTNEQFFNCVFKVAKVRGFRDYFLFKVQVEHI